MATYHELLAIVRIAQEAHEKPEREGGHDAPLNMRCFLSAVQENAQAMGYPPGTLLSQFKTKFPVLIQKGWILMAAQDRCSDGHFMLTEAGYAQLEEWNRKGCIAHESGVGARTSRAGRKCAGRKRLRAPDYAA